MGILYHINQIPPPLGEHENTFPVHSVDCWTFVSDPSIFPEGRHHTEPQLIPSLETMWDPHIPLPLMEGNWATP